MTPSVNPPTLDPCAAETVSVDVPTAFGGGVTGLGRLKVTPLGAVPSHDTVNPTAELNPACESIVMTELPDVPWLMVITVGLAEIEKSEVTP